MNDKQQKFLYGKIITIEGSDGVGKETQSKLLAEALEKDGYDVTLLSFPSYGTIQAKPLELYLQGELGGLDYLSSEEISALYAIDRSATLRHKNIWDKLENKSIIITDRFTESNIIYQVAKLENSDNELRLIRNIEILEKGALGIPASDLVIYLDINREISKKLIIDRNEKTDIHEKHDEYLEKVTKTGRELAKKFEWNYIQCASDEGYILSKENIHSKIMDIVNNNIDKWVWYPNKNNK